MRQLSLLFGKRADSTAPVLCLTATAKPEVVRDIRDHFQTRLGVDLILLDRGTARTNLSFAVRPTQQATKLTVILAAIEANLPPEGAVAYCATRSATEKLAEFLKGQGLSADFFRAGLPPDRQRDVQEAFRAWQLQVIAATNAFGNVSFKVAMAVPSAAMVAGEKAMPRVVAAKAAVTRTAIVSVPSLTVGLKVRVRFASALAKVGAAKRGLAVSASAKDSVGPSVWTQAKVRLCPGSLAKDATPINATAAFAATGWSGPALAVGA